MHINDLVGSEVYVCGDNTKLLKHILKYVNTGENRDANLNNYKTGLIIGCLSHILRSTK